MAQPSTLTALPNLLTYGRVVAIPVIVLLLLAETQISIWLAFLLYVAAAVTDWLDGYLARRSNLTSPLGQMLDPIADKMLVGALIVTFAWTGVLGIWGLLPALLILLREILVSGLREFMGDRKIRVTQLAKWKTTVQMVALAVVLLTAALPALYPVGLALLWLAAVLTVITGYEYFRGAWPSLRGDAL